MHLALVPPGFELFDPIWPLVEKLLRPACENSLGMHTIESTHARLKAGHCHLWVVVDDSQKIVAAYVSSMLDCPSGLKALMIELPSGPWSLLASLNERLELWAFDNGARAVFFPVGKHQISKFPKGYRMGRYLMCKELSCTSH